MKLFRKLLALITLAIGLPFSLAQAQSYSFSVPANGTLELSMRYWSDQPYWNGGTGGSALFDTLGETVTLDLNAQTIRQQGVISVPSPTSVSVRSDMFYLQGQQIPFTLSITQTLRNASLVFDTGTQPMIWDSASQTYSFDGRLKNIVSVDGFYSLATGGETLTGSFSYSLHPDAFEPVTYSQLALAAGQSPTLVYNGPSPQMYDQMGSTPAFEVTAANGVHLLCGAGNVKDSWDFLIWHPENVALIPEPCAVSFIGLGACALVLVHRRKTKNLPAQ
jgi:hypothetical protein